jgi:hypothetical protein
MNEDKLFVLKNESSVVEYPNYIGRVEILPNIYYELTTMPNRFHRLMMRLLFGWKFSVYAKNTPSEKMLLNG